MTRLDKALAALVAAIAKGAEFPDACYEFSRKHRVDYKALTAAYDEHCMKGDCE